jgi:mannose-1-phosphate guanylyltransferase / mannose-6-phosphate isomerase
MYKRGRNTAEDGNQADTSTSHCDAEHTRSGRDLDVAGSAKVPESLPCQLPLAPVILAGGAGTRLWPLSREQYPKQLIDLLGGDTLLQATVRRTEGLAASHAMAAPIVVCGSEHRFATVQQLRGYGADASHS